MATGRSQVRNYKLNRGSWLLLAEDYARAMPPMPCSGAGALTEVVPLKGLEPPTPSLRMTCSTS